MNSEENPFDAEFAIDRVRRQEQELNAVYALFKNYFGEDVVEKLLSAWPGLREENEVMMHILIAASQPLVSLRRDVARRLILSRLLGPDKFSKLMWMRLAAKNVKRWADGSRLRSWVRGRNRGLKDSRKRKLARAELLKKAFPSGFVSRGFHGEPYLYRCIQKHMYNLREGRAYSNKPVDDQLRWCFRADYIVANIWRLRQSCSQSCVVFSFENWKMTGSPRRREQRARVFRSFLERVRQSSIFPAHTMVVVHLDQRELPLGSAVRAARFLTAQVIDADITEGDWTGLLMEMEALVERLGDTHASAEVCLVRDLL
ncbi:hypothetical protein Cob_v007245 [Colletotrichum orbiculare MAFF 240422]|uniref:Uncharacterized protein n=1 Tax=Colletotrichum orbiculare (strain 104-T / ATCC 96160 / CBS 514.97 / LARS 414 / MAFF 240422) TaxID=1213857 RepID=N4UMD1_COLOR|nr:hypothetical protein Cob_v007245 [Colletotrichum orbiculare MAFF 240422]